MEQDFHIKARIVDDETPIKANLNQSNGDVATTTKKGIMRFATEEEALDGTSNDTAITPHTLNTVNSTNNASINARIESLENAEDSEMEDIISLIQTRTNNMIQFND